MFCFRLKKKKKENDTNAEQNARRGKKITIRFYVILMKKHRWHSISFRFDKNNTSAKEQPTCQQNFRVIKCELDKSWNL